MSRQIKLYTFKYMHFSIVQLYLKVEKVKITGKCRDY